MFSILHISDLHRSANEPIRNETLVAALLQDRDRYTTETPQIPSPNAIVVSGDLIHGAPWQHDDYQNVEILEPTAGREALTTDSMQFLQSLVAEVDTFVSREIADRPECDSSTPFMSWVVSNGRYELCGRLRAVVRPGDRMKLKDVKTVSREHGILVYPGQDQSFVRSVATEEKPVLVLSRSNPRRVCEKRYLDKYCKVEELENKPVVQDTKEHEEYSTAESAFVYRLKLILDVDYFLDTARVELGTISHGLPVFAETKKQEVRVTINPNGETVGLILNVYEGDLAAFGSLVKDFARNVVFPSVAQYVPSSSRLGAETFLKTIRRPRDIVEYDQSDQEDLGEVWKDYFAVKRSLRTGTRRVWPRIGRSLGVGRTVPDRDGRCGQPRSMARHSAA